MKMNGIHTQAHCRDADGQIVLVTLERVGNDGDLEICLTQFKEMAITWQGKMGIEELRETILERDDNG